MSDQPPTLLHLVHRLPFPLDKGDRIRSFHSLRFLAERATIHLACLADEEFPSDAIESLKRYCARVVVVPLGRARWLHALASVARGNSITTGAFWSSELANHLRIWTKDIRYDAVLASSSAMVPYLRLPELITIPAIVDLVDVDSQKWMDYAPAATAPKRWLYRLESRRLRRLEKGLPFWTRGVLLTTPAEADIYEAIAGQETATVINNGVDLEYFQPCTEFAFTDPPDELTGARQPSCAFVGALDYKPNVDGITWFCAEVWPQIHGLRPESKLYLVGRKPAPAVLALANMSGVEVVGGVPDVRPWVARSVVVVVPLRIARGVQNKILEALAMAKPVVASPACLGGLQARTGQDLLAATTPEEWTRIVLQLFDDPELRRRLGSAGREHVEQLHCWQRCLEPLGELVSRVVRPVRPTVASSR